MFVEMTLTKIVLCETENRSLLFLHELNGSREMFLTIGILETFMLKRMLNGEPSARPLTHELICGIICQLGGDFESILIDRLENNIFYAKLRIRQNGVWRDVDARPSDAITLAVTHVPMRRIYVHERVLEQLEIEP